MRGILRTLLIAILLGQAVFPALADRDRDRWRDRDDRPYSDDDDRGRRGRDRDRDHDRARDGVRSGRLVSLDSILSSIDRRYPGRNLDIDGPYNSGDRLVYRIKWLTHDGRVIIFVVDAETGQIISQRGGQ
jgi:Peptidase propeptide and YPEB domain